MIQLHLISFDIPEPPDYGGVIDVFYKIKVLAALGVKIHLHCFEYGRAKSAVLETICASVQYYPRKKWWQSIPIKTPHIVSSRYSKKLLENLQKDDFPILFEGLHTCAILGHSSLKNRLKLVRTHNIEHEYYWYLHIPEKSKWRQYYFLREAHLLSKFEEELKHANHILAISPNDTQSIQQRLPHNLVHYLPAFHPNQQVDIQLGKGNYLLYHGNLSVNENQGVMAYLIKAIATHIDYPIIIAGKNPPADLVEEAKKYAHIQVIANPSHSEMEDLIREAHIHFLPTFQATGIKLKLLQSLYKGRFCLVNIPMVDNTGLGGLCYIAETVYDFIDHIKNLCEVEFTSEMKEQRIQVLNKLFDNRENAQKIIKLVR